MTAHPSDEPLSPRRRVLLLVTTWIVGVSLLLGTCVLHAHEPIVQQSDELWFGSHIAIALAVAPFLWIGTGLLRSIPLRIVLFVIQGAIAFVVYLAITVLYILEFTDGPF
jgi:hypothetical protein